jgi:1-acyl-sn-glycerol-3-phosphate acyltransferase
MGSFKLGIGKLVSLMEIPVIPIGIRGLYKIFPRTRKFPRLGAGKVTIKFGSSISFKGEPQSSIVNRLSDEVQSLIKE